MRFYGRPQNRTFREASAGIRFRTVRRKNPTGVAGPNEEEPMIRIATTQLWVHDQDVALDFYTNKVGLEVRADVTVPELGTSAG